MLLDVRLAGLIDPFQARMRASAFGPELPGCDGPRAGSRGAARTDGG